MKSMTCYQLGGACDHTFEGETFDDIARLSKQHALEMYQKGDVPHLEAMRRMQMLMTSPESMQKWMDEKQQEFESLP